MAAGGLLRTHRTHRTYKTQRAIRLRKKPLTEPIREIINDLGLSIRKEFAVVAVRGNEAWIMGIGHIGCM